MLTTSQAARLLADTTSLDALASLLGRLGFDPPLPIDRAQARRLGFSPGIRGARLSAGRGTLRALVVGLDAEAKAREQVIALCRELVRRAPEPLWLILARDERSGALFIAAPPPTRLGPIPALEVDPARVRDSDAETFALLCGIDEASDLLVHQRWRDTLGRDALTRRFYGELERVVREMAASAVGRASAEERHTIALLHTSRLLFVSFLEARGWLDGNRDFLRVQFAARAGRGGAHRGLLEPLWFGTLNTSPPKRARAAREFGRVPFLNGGLFTRTALERTHRELRLTDESIGAVLDGLLARYRLTARESSSAWSDAAVDPEMLGRAFESLMHSDQRRAQGAFYTPPALLTDLTRDGIVAALEPAGVAAVTLRQGWRDGFVPADERGSLRDALRGIRVLDPACGSGAFLVTAQEELAALLALAGDTRPLAARRRDVLTRSIFGVDVNPMAVWLCQLRLWLSVVVEDEVEDPLALAPLPNLDRNVREGDSLAGDGFALGAAAGDVTGARGANGATLARARLRYARAVGARKRVLARVLDRDERAQARRLLEARVAALTAERRELLIAARSPDLFAGRRHVSASTREALVDLRAALRRTRSQLAALRLGAALPFSFATHFADVAAAGGFSLVLGNPPWVRPHAVPPDERAALRARYRVVRSAAWEAGARSAAAGAGFAGQVDLAALFTERAVALTRPQGAIALLLPTKLWGSLAGGGLRALLLDEAPPRRLWDWSESSAGFDAAVYPSAIVARRRALAAPPRLAQPDERSRSPVLMTVHRHGVPLTWATPGDALTFDASVGAPWLLVPPEVRAAFQSVERAGVALAASALGRPLLGVKSGCNEAFVLSAEVAAAEGIEPQCLRPLLRGDEVRAWRDASAGTRDAILWTHDRRGLPLDSLPTATLRRLAPWRRRLEQRSDARGQRWWALFRTESARCDRPRVVWSDIGRRPRALVLGVGDLTVPLNTCYVVRTPTETDAHALAALLNSTLAAAWLGVIAEPARGGYRRYLGWTCARLPLPREWPRAREALAPLGRAAQLGRTPHEMELLEAVLDAFGLSHETVAPLLSWYGL